MKLSIEQVKSITKGAERITEEAKGFCFYRFSEEEGEFYRERAKEKNDPFMYERTKYTAGIRFLFRTNSKTLTLKTILSMAGSRRYFSFDVYVNNEPIGYIDNFSEMGLPQNYITTEVPIAESYEKIFELGEGDKTVCVYFPWSMIAMIQEVSIDDGAYIEAIDLKKKIICYGDSITQGYDVQRSSLRYAARIAEALGAEEINKAIGGERFVPGLVEIKVDYQPEYILVAYGTNDWTHHGFDVFQGNCKAFLKAVSENYPDTTIFVLTPIWRGDMMQEKKSGEFEDVGKYIKEFAVPYKNIHVIDGFDLVPKDGTYYADGWLHPNDKGFMCYYENLKKQILDRISIN